MIDNHNTLRNLLAQAQRKYRQKRFSEAEGTVREVLQAAPEDADALVMLGCILLQDTGRLEEAGRALHLAFRLKPQHPALPANFGALAWARGDWEEAERQFGRAMELEPDRLLLRVNWAHALRRLGKIEASIAQYEYILQRKPELSRVSASLASAYEYLGRYAEADHYYSHALRWRPDFAEARYARGMLRLRLGRFTAGWRDYEWRFEATARDYLDGADWQRRLWQGEPYRGRTLLVYHEQGLGDGIHFIRYLPQVKQLGGRIILKCATALHRLAASMYCADLIIDRKRRLSADDVDYDLHVPLMSLPRILGTELSTVPAEVPYLSVSPDLARSWSQVVDNTKLNVGLVWAGKDRPDSFARSCRLADLFPLASIPGVRFYSLQKGRGASELASRPDELEILNVAGDLSDLADTAAIMENLDIIVTIDTVTAHLAGAIGKPTWVLLSKHHCWRYLVDRADSPWYPSMVLLRQKTHGDWSDPVFEVRGRLAALAATKLDRGPQVPEQRPRVKAKAR